MEDARKAVRQRYKDGADWIKITATGGVLSVAKSGQNPQFTMEELEAIVDTAADYGMRVAAHAHGTEGMKRAVLAGVASIEHGTYMTEEVMDLMIERGTYFVPTIMAGNWVAEKATIDGFFPELVRPKAAAIGPIIADTFAKAYRRGVPIVFGTDTGVSAHGDNAHGICADGQRWHATDGSHSVSNERRRRLPGHRRHARSHQGRLPGGHRRGSRQPARGHYANAGSQLCDEGWHNLQIDSDKGSEPGSDPL